MITGLCGIVMLIKIAMLTSEIALYETVCDLRPLAFKPLDGISGSLSSVAVIFYGIPIQLLVKLICDVSLDRSAMYP